MKDKVLQDIIERLKIVFLLRFDTDLAKLLTNEKNLNYISICKKRHTIKYDLIIEKCAEKGIDLNYIFLGKKLFDMNEYNNLLSKYEQLKEDYDKLLKAIGTKSEITELSRKI